MTTEICAVYTFSNIFRQILPFSVKLLFLKQTELYGMCQFTESGKKRISNKLEAISDIMWARNKLQDTYRKVECEKLAAENERILN